MNSPDELLNKILGVKRMYRDLSINHWIEYELFTWQWILSIAFCIVPFVIWWKIVDRKRILEICIFGLTVNVSASFLDVSGSELVLWEYPIRLLPHTPMLFPVDLIVVPIMLMLIYQYYPEWKQFLIVNILAAAVMAFILEPIATTTNHYLLISWKFIYSFPLYVLIAVISRLITEKIISNKI